MTARADLAALVKGDRVTVCDAFGAMLDVVTIGASFRLSMRDEHHRSWSRVTGHRNYHGQGDTIRPYRPRDEDRIRLARALRDAEALAASKARDVAWMRGNIARLERDLEDAREGMTQREAAEVRAAAALEMARADVARIEERP